MDGNVRGATNGATAADVESMQGIDYVERINRGSAAKGAAAYVPPAEASLAGAAAMALRYEVETLLFRQAALLDGKRWQDWTELFTDDGVYWMPIESHQTDWTSEPSIFAEDRGLMDMRARRLNHPNAWSQAAAWGTNHLVGNVIIESVGEASGTAKDIHVSSRFQMMELREERIRHFGGSYRHHLIRSEHGLKIKLQRVDLMNGRAPYDFVLQAWL